MSDKNILETALVTGEKEISQIYKDAILSIMKTKKITTDQEFLVELTYSISSKYVMNMEVIEKLPTDVDEFWNLTRKLRIYKEFKAYLFNKKPEKKVVVKLEKSSRRKLIFVNPK